MELKKILIAAVLVAGMAFQTNAADIPRKEYPRPQFERTAWVNLNGEWDYTFDFANSGMEQEYHKSYFLLRKDNSTFLSGKQFIRCRA